MRIVEGFVCTAKSVEPIKQERLFGPNTGNSDFSHQTFVSNGLVPFSVLEDAIQALPGLRERKWILALTAIGLAQLKMEISETEDEEEQMRGKKNLIAVCPYPTGEYGLYGRKVGGIQGVAQAPVSDLELNGFQTLGRLYIPPSDMLGVLYEIRRQGRLETSLATFEMKRLKPKDYLK